MAVHRPITNFEQYDYDHELIATMSLFLEHGAIVDAKLKDSHTPLLVAACYCKDHKIVRQLLRKGADPYVVDRDEEMAVHKAAREGGRETLKYLIRKFPKMIDSRTGLGETPLMLAIENRRLEIARDLISEGAQLDATNSLGRSLIFFAAASNKLDVFRYTETFRLQSPSLDQSGQTILHIACRYGTFRLAEYLLKHGADGNDIKHDHPMISA
jgi:ankyrin repeat protein